MKKVLIACTISKKLNDFLLENNFQIITYENILPEVLENIHGIITSNKLKLDRNTLQQFKSLKWIARLGSGIEIIDTAYCVENNIYYFNTPHGIANAVAEHATGMLLSLLHNIHTSFYEIKNGKWIREANRGIELDNLTLGIIGYGNTGSAFAKKMSVFVKDIFVYDKYKIDIKETFVTQTTLSQLQEVADIISFHVPWNIETDDYYNKDFIAQCKKKHILINTSRGAIAKSETIMYALNQNKLKGAVIDVLDLERNIIKEIENLDSLLYVLANDKRIIMTPHIAGYTLNAIEKMSYIIIEKLESYYSQDNNQAF